MLRQLRPTSGPRGAMWRICDGFSLENDPCQSQVSRHDRAVWTNRENAGVRSPCSKKGLRGSASEFLEDLFRRLARGVEAERLVRLRARLVGPAEELQRLGVVDEEVGDL